jgi:hypothetical protein
VPKGGSRRLLRERLAGRGTQLGEAARTFSVPTSRSPEVTAPAAQVDTSPGPAVAVVAPTAPAREEPKSRASRPTRRERSRTDNTLQPDALVGGLLSVTERLYGVRETATAIAAHLRETVRVDAVAVLLPDGPLWTVAGAVGHRHLEERLSLRADHWLVIEVSSAHHGIVIEDTDIARSRLAGAPLAAWPHLLAAPINSVDGVVVLARGDLGPAFTSTDLARTSSVLSEADSLFVSSVKVRELARRLVTFAELDDPAFD